MIRMIRWKHPSIESHFLGWLAGFADLIDGLVVIFTLGTYTTNFGFEVACYRTRRQFLKRKK